MKISHPNCQLHIPMGNTANNRPRPSVTIYSPQRLLRGLHQLDMRETNLRAVMNDVRQNPSSPFMYLDMGEWGNGNMKTCDM